MKRTKLKFSLFSILAMLTIAVFVTSCEQDDLELEKEKTEFIELDKMFNNYEILEIDNAPIWNSVKSQLGGKIMLDLGALTEHSSLADLSFDLNRIEVETEDFKMILVGKDNKLEEVEPVETHVLVGNLKNQQGRVMLGITENDFRTEVMINEEIYRIEPLKDFLQNATATQYIKYKSDDEVKQNQSCGENSENDGIEVNEQNINSRNAIDYVEITAIGDYDLHRKYWNTSYAFSWMYWRMVNGGLRYDHYNNFPVRFRIKAYYLYTWPSYIATQVNDGNLFLDQWRNFLKLNSWINYGDVNLLFTGKNTFDQYGNDIIGLAYHSTICSNIVGSAACYVEHQWSTYMSDNVVAHEVGHILGHPGHFPFGFMREDGGDWQMAGYSKTQIENHLVNNSNCLY